VSPKTKAALVLSGVFVLGGVAGAGASRLYTFHKFNKLMSAPPEQRAHFRVEVMRHELDLDDAQATKIEGIIHDAEPERAHASEPCKPELDAIRQSTDAKIIDVLKPEQRTKYDELAKRRHGPPPP
jgi:Spy/CpxP family protein refolding chaperone